MPGFMSLKRTLRDSGTINTGTSGSVSLPFGVREVYVNAAGNPGNPGTAGTGGAAGNPGTAGTGGNGGTGGSGGPALSAGSGGGVGQQAIWDVGNGTGNKFGAGGAAGANGYPPPGVIPATAGDSGVADPFWAFGGTGANAPNASVAADGGPGGIGAGVGPSASPNGAYSRAGAGGGGGAGGYATAGNPGGAGNPGNAGSPGTAPAPARAGNAGSSGNAGGSVNLSLQLTASSIPLSAAPRGPTRTHGGDQPTPPRDRGFGIGAFGPRGEFLRSPPRRSRGLRRGCF